MATTKAKAAKEDPAPEPKDPEPFDPFRPKGEAVDIATATANLDKLLHPKA